MRAFLTPITLKKVPLGKPSPVRTTAMKSYISQEGMTDDKVVEKNAEF
jgi:hypothetical protein